MGQAQWTLLALGTSRHRRRLHWPGCHGRLCRGGDQGDDGHLLVTMATNRMPFGFSGERIEWHLMAVYDVKTKKVSGLLNHVRTDAQVMNVVYGRPVIRRTDKGTLIYIHGLQVSGRTEA